MPFDLDGLRELTALVRAQPALLNAGGRLKWRTCTAVFVSCVWSVSVRSCASHSMSLSLAATCPRARMHRPPDGARAGVRREVRVLCVRQDRRRQDAEVCVVQSAALLLLRVPGTIPSLVPHVLVYRGAMVWRNNCTVRVPIALR